MSVARTREIIARLKAAGITVHEQAGWETRGNGQSPAYEGFEWHHTATPFANQNLGILINGRSDLSGPLCNSCGWADGSVGIIAAFPANHAGASGGYNTSPLPKTGLFNKLVWGHEIIYPGTSPMTAAQYRTATILAKICTDIFGYSDINRAKGHAETSITGKWDPGYASGKTYDLNKMRADARGAAVVSPPTNGEEDDMGVIVNSYEPKLDDKGNPVTQKFVFIIPTIKSIGTVATNSWISVKSGWGPIDKVHVYGIKSGATATYSIDQTFTNVKADAQRVNLGSVDGMDQWSLEVTSRVTFGITLEYR